MTTVEQNGGDEPTVVRRPSRPGRTRPGHLSGKIAEGLPAILFLIGLIAIWKFASAMMPPVLLPSPERVLTRFVTMWSTAGFLSYAATTVMHVLLSVSIAFVSGLVIALTVYFLPTLNGAVYRRLAPFLNAFPGVGWAFLALIWFGINSSAVVFASSIAMLPLAIINIGAGLREMNRDAIEMALSFTRSTPRRIRLVMLPLMFPYMFATLRLCFGVSWQIVLVVELLSGAPGLGAVISVARQRYWTDMIFSVVALILIAVFIMDRLIFARLQSRIGKTYNA